MASKTTNPWKQPNKSPKKNESSFPGLKSVGPAPTSTTPYEERQQNELFVLRSVFQDDFIDHEATHHAWKKSEPSFDIRIRATQNPDFALTLGVVFTATYPRSPPLLTLKQHDHLHEGTVYKIERLIQTKSKAFAAEEAELIVDLVEDIKEVLEDAAAHRAAGQKLPSLEEERAVHEAEAVRAAEEAKEQEDRKHREQLLKDELAMKAKVEKEVELQKDRETTRAKQSKKKDRNNRSPARSVEEIPEMEAVSFDDICTWADATGNATSFRTVTGLWPFRHGPISTVCLVKPVLAGNEECPILALKQTVLRPQGRDSGEFFKQRQELETKLRIVKDLRASKKSDNILQVLGFRIEKVATTDDASDSSTYTVSVLTMLAEQGSLEDLLVVAGQLEVGKLRSWSRDLLDALNFLHNSNVVHGDIQPNNILLFRESNGNVVPKLADISYQRELHTIHTKRRTMASMRTARSAYWIAPEIASLAEPTYTYKTDIWDFGIVFLQMIFGLDVYRKHTSPQVFIDSVPISDSLEELVSKLFTVEPKRRPRAFDLAASEFLALDAPVYAESSTAIISGSTTSLPRQVPSGVRQNSTIRVGSRYQEDYLEEGRLGKGGFGEVVKARRKLDGQIYAIKKITQRSEESLSNILKEVRLLSQLSHPAVVRYYTAWTENIPDGSAVVDDESVEDTAEDFSDSQFDIQFTNTKSAGLDFVSSSGHPDGGVVFEDSDEDEDEDEDELGTIHENDMHSDEESDSESDEDDDDDDTIEDLGSTSQLNLVARKRPRRFSNRGYRTVMYISMEYCEKRTLRDLIQRNLSKDVQEVWRLFRQIIEGLAHIHSLGIVHRDLKPENIFISVGPDSVDNVKIGDFGLATIGQLAGDKSLLSSNVDATDETRSIGTSVYVAPEVRTGGSGSYTPKVDMYSLGVFFFEMCYPPMLGMQRADVLTKLRASPPTLPQDFKPKEKSQVEIILSLVTHSPKDRPSGVELLKSGKLPVQMESEALRRALAGLSDPNSPYYEKMLSMLFNQPVDPARDYAWDMSTSTITASDLMRQYSVRDVLTTVFRRHGAVEMPRHSLYPRSPLYNKNVVQLLDQSGTLVQLPFDLTMSHARSLAKNANAAVVQQSYSFGNVYRDKTNGTGGRQPSIFGEVDFDIVTTDTLDLALKEAEVIKVIDEIIQVFPFLYSQPMSFQVGHSDLLNLIFDFCGIEQDARRAVADCLSNLHIRNTTWQKIRTELRSPLIGASATSIDALEKFDYKDTPGKAFNKLKAIFQGTNLYQKAAPTIAHLKEVVEYCGKFGVSHKVYICPLNTWNEVFFSGGIMFACLLDKKTKDVFAAGGRYDSLVKQHRPRIGTPFEERHAVGFTLNWEKLAQASVKTSSKAQLKRAMTDDEGQGVFGIKRCDVLVASFDPVLLRTNGLEILQTLWAQEISAELAKDARSPEDLAMKHRGGQHSWIVIVKQESLKVKTQNRKDVQDVEMPASRLVAWLRAEIRERELRTQVRFRSLAGSGSGGPSSSEPSSSTAGPDRDRVVHVVADSGTGGKKKSGGKKQHDSQSSYAIIEQAQAGAVKLVDSLRDGPIAALDASDAALELVQRTCFSDPGSWRRAEQGVKADERPGLRELRDTLESWAREHQHVGGPQNAFVFSSRTGRCVLYDLAA